MQRSRALFDDLVLCCCVLLSLSYSVLIFSTTDARPQRCRRSFHDHRHPRRTAAATAAAAAAAAAVRRLLCCGCGWGLLRLFLEYNNWLFCCGDGRSDRPRPSCCAAIHLAGPSPPPPPPPPLLLLKLRSYCCCAAVLTLSYPCSKSGLRSLLREMDAAVRGFCTSQEHTFLCFVSFFCGNFITNSAIANSAKCMPE